MQFSLDVCRARKGDCLLLHFGRKEEPGLVLIDGGPSNVYQPHLRPRLKRIQESRGLGDHSLPIDLLMVSHVDDDHIRGILDLTGELLTRPGPPFVRVFSFWHNSFEDLLAEEPAHAAAQFGAASLLQDFPLDDALEPDQEEEVLRDTQKVLAGIQQGQRLRADADNVKLGWPRNPEFNGELIVGGPGKCLVGADLNFIVAGPMQPEISKLRKLHARWLQEQREKNLGGAAALAAYADKSVANLSSIVVLASCHGKSMLFTGDARGDKILEGLEAVGVMRANKTMHLDVLKVPHHGSANNLEIDFFKRITADHYVFSGNGEHGNPERESLEMLFAARKQQPLSIHLTYPVEEIDRARKEDYETQQAKERGRNARLQQQGKPIKKPARKDWSHQEHSLEAFFDQVKPKPDQKIQTVAQHRAHVIDLLEPLGV